MSGGTATTTCWGCRKSETHPIVHGEEFKKQREEMASRGWRRRQFWPSPHWDKGPWFCSEDCATESYNAKQAEEYWAKEDQKRRDEEFQKYCQETPLPYWVRNLTVFIIAFSISYVVVQIITKVVQ